ncbi:MAG: hypothetical protein HWE30_12680 [Methylocystaceae bacterium]|nr:hypothetical protein [Methylocystaceae bacterium]
MDNTESLLLRAGGKDQLLADFCALKEALTLEGLPKYAERPVLENLAKFLTAQSGGPHKDIALYELAHLVYGVADHLGKDRVTDFFLSPDKASPNRYQSLFADSCDEQGLKLIYDDGVFVIRYGRMGFLCALYEFLCSMDGFSHFADITATFEKLTNGPLTGSSLRTCANTLGSILRKYRMAYLTSAAGDGKFTQVYKFLHENSHDGQIILKDDSVLDFWCLHNKGKEYKGYRTVFDLFSDFAHAFEESQRGQNAHRAAPLGLDHEAGEIDLAHDDVETAMLEEWSSPFDIFDEDDFSDIRFFKKKSERGPIENLMAYGPDALRLPVAFVRYEVFGQVQSGITNDLQVGRGKASVEQRMSCDAAVSYEDRVKECIAIRSHIKALQASSLHVLAQDQDEKVVSFTQKAFSKMTRKGFDDQALGKSDVFAKAADALVVMERQLDRYIENLEAQNLKTLFDQDRATFQNEFSQLYKEAVT